VKTCPPQARFRPTHRLRETQARREHPAVRGDETGGPAATSTPCSTSGWVVEATKTYGPRRKPRGASSSRTHLERCMVVATLRKVRVVRGANTQRYRVSILLRGAISTDVPRGFAADSLEAVRVAAPHRRCEAEPGARPCGLPRHEGARPARVNGPAVLPLAEPRPKHRRWRDAGQQAVRNVDRALRSHYGISRRDRAVLERSLQHPNPRVQLYVAELIYQGERERAESRVGWEQDEPPSDRTSAYEGQCYSRQTSRPSFAR
jgi:hypothetical protein